MLKGIARKPEFISVLADVFIETGYHRTTTAELARRCEVRENELYRIWPSKKEMFLDAIRHIFNSTLSVWANVISEDTGEGTTPAERLIHHQARDHGRHRFCRLIFSGLAELDDADVRRELKQMYKRFHDSVTKYVASDRSTRPGEHALDDCQSAWAIIGIGAIVDIQRELGILPKAERGKLLQAVSLAILNRT